MGQADATTKRIMLTLLNEFTARHTVTSLAQQLEFSRVGTWKALRKLETAGYVLFEKIGEGKTSVITMQLNWENMLVEKYLALYLTEEALTQRRWRSTFTELEPLLDFMLVYGSALRTPQHAHDIDILGVSSGKRFTNIDKKIQSIQKMQLKKNHLIMFSEKELADELRKLNPAFVNAIKNGVVLFGQDQFIRFIRGLQS